jgi:hypothetical protein
MKASTYRHVVCCALVSFGNRSATLCPRKQSHESVFVHSISSSDYGFRDIKKYCLNFQKYCIKYNKHDLSLHSLNMFHSMSYGFSNMRLVGGFKNIFGEAQCRNFSRGVAGALQRILNMRERSLGLTKAAHETDAPRFRLEATGKMESAIANAEWLGNSTVQLEQLRLRG